MHFRDPVDDLQTKTRSLQPISLDVRARRPAGGGAAVVEDGKARTGTGGHDDRRPFSGVLDGVVDQIAQGVLDQGAMAAKRFGLPLLERNGPAGIENQGGERGDDMLRRLYRINCLRGGDAGAFQTRQGRELLDQPIEGLEILLHLAGPGIGDLFELQARHREGRTHFVEMADVMTRCDCIRVNTRSKAAFTALV